MKIQIQKSFRKQKSQILVIRSEYVLCIFGVMMLIEVRGISEVCHDEIK